MMCDVPSNQRLPPDETNVRLLTDLQGDARLTLAELGRRVGLSAPAVAERLQRLEQEGVIRGYRVELDPERLGYPLTAVIRIRPAPRQIPKVAEIARAAPEVVACDRITGDDCYLLRAHLRSVTHLEQLIDRFTPFGQTTTSIVQSSPVPARGLAVGLSAADGEPAPDRPTPTRS
jgi:Lrp/AsnC family leucine-responsive transcriptional regulator